MLTTTEIVSLANLYRSGSCFSLYVLILSLILLSFARAWILGIHRLRFFAYSHSRADCMYHIKLFWWRPPHSFVYSKNLLIDLNMGFVKNILDVDSFRVLKGYTYVRLTARPFVFLTLRRCRYMEGKLSLSLTQFVTTTPRRISNVCKSGICRLSSCNCVPGPVEPSILPSNRDNLLCQKKKTASNLRLWEQRSRRMRIFLFLLHDIKWAILVCMPDFLSFFYVAEGNKLTISLKEMYHWNWY